MCEYHIAKLTEQFEAFVDAFERLDNHVLFLCMHDNEEAANDSNTVSHLHEVLENVLAKRAYLTPDDLARVFHLFTEALK